MKVSRSIFVAAAAFVAAACGDKVEIIQPTTSTTASVTGVSVSPANVSMTVGQTVTFTAVVDVTNGAAQTVTWSPTSGAVSVSSAGVATANSATAGVAVCATSTVDATKKGCAQAVVSATAPVVPATVSIQSITVNAGGLNAPVNPAAVAGIIDVRVNVSPGNETVTKVVLLVGNVRADSQTFTAAQSAALRYVAEEAIANQSAFPPILFTINTAKFNATTGVPAFLNGNNIISVQLFTTGSATVARATATYQTPLTFINADTYIASVATSGTTANAISATGFRYDRGSLTVSAIPVSYSGRVVQAATVFFGSACDASGTGQRNIALTAPASGSSAWTATLPVTIPTGGVIVNTVNSYEFTNNGTALCTALNPIGETIAVTGTDSNGDALFSVAAPANVAALTSLRLDNRAPQVGSPTLVFNPNGRNNQWINAAVGLLATNNTAPAAPSTTSNNIVTNPALTACAAGTTARDCGEGSYVRFARIANNTGGLVDDARAATAASTATLPARSLTPSTYCLIVTAQDALGNETARPAAGTPCLVAAAGPASQQAVNHMAFGVDLDAPVINYASTTASGSIPAVPTALNANERRNTAATIGNSFTVAVLDTGTVGNSGMNTASSVRGTVTLRNEAASPAIVAGVAAVGAARCVVGALSGTDGFTCNDANISAAAPGVGGIVATGAAVSGSGVPGYYTATLLARDDAGNSSATVTRVIGYNLTANVPALTNALFNVPLSGGTATFNANASSNFDLWNVTYELTYGGALGFPITYPSALINAFNSTPQLFSNVPAGITFTNFVRQVEGVTANAALAVTAAFKPTNLGGVVRDNANVPSAVSNTAITGAQVTTGVSYMAAPAGPGGTRVHSWSVSNAATNVSSGATTPAANPLSVVLTADAIGPTATFNPPFARVDFYALVDMTGNGATADDRFEQIGTTAALNTIDDGSPFGRRHRYSITWTPGTTSPVTGTAWVMGAQTVIAIGVSAAGDGLVSPVAATITITNP